MNIVQYSRERYIISEEAYFYISLYANYYDCYSKNFLIQRKLSCRFLCKLIFLRIRLKKRNLNRNFVHLLNIIQKNFFWKFYVFLYVKVFHKCMKIRKYIVTESTYINRTLLCGVSNLQISINILHFCTSYFIYLCYVLRHKKFYNICRVQ